MPGQEALDNRQGRDESAGKVGKRRRADDHQQGDAVAHDGVAFVRLVANPTVMGERNPASLTDAFEPRLVRGIRGEMIVVPLDRQAV